MNAAKLSTTVEFLIPQFEKNALGRMENMGDIVIVRQAMVDYKNGRVFARRGLTGVDIDALVTVRSSLMLRAAREVIMDGARYKIVPPIQLTPSKMYFEMQVQKV